MVFPNVFPFSYEFLLEGQDSPPAARHPKRQGAEVVQRLRLAVHGGHEHWPGRPETEVVTEVGHETNEEIPKRICLTIVK